MRRGGHAAPRHRMEPESPFWISYADLMTSLTIMLILMVCAFLLKVHEERAGIDKQIQVKRTIIQQLLDRLGRKYPVSVDPRTGAVTIENQILFGFDETRITPRGQGFLTKLIPEYASILLYDPEIRQHIAQIMVVGYADRVGSYDVNLQRSVERAYNVSTFIFSKIPQFPEREHLRQVLSTNGRSNMEQKETDSLSRRVEIRFQMKDWDLVKAGKMKIGAEAVQ